MSFPISGSAPPGPGLDPAAEAAAGLCTPLRTSPSTTATTNAGAQVDLSRSVFFTGDMPLRAYLATPQSDLVKHELERAFQRLQTHLAPADSIDRLQQGLKGLQDSMNLDAGRLAQMLGHGKRWLTQLLQLLESDPRIERSDRVDLCERLATALQSDSMPPARAFGSALDALRRRIPGGADANGIRALLQERALLLLVKERHLTGGQARKIPADVQVRSLLEAFGFRPADPSTRLSAPAPTVEELNIAATGMENRLEAQIFPVAHELLNRFSSCFHAAWERSPPEGPLLSPADQDAVVGVLQLLGQSMKVDLTDFLRSTPPNGPPQWALHDAWSFKERIQAALPELSPSWGRPASPLLPPPLAAMSPRGDASDEAQERGSGATGAFSAGTGGASRRGPA